LDGSLKVEDVGGDAPRADNGTQRVADDVGVRVGAGSGPLRSPAVGADVDKMKCWL
jgi:hypothetical protein